MVPLGDSGLVWSLGLGACALAYLLGSVPFGLVLTRLAGLGDLRTMGSGNIGATNVLRTGRKDLAFATLVLDAGKGGIAVLLVWALMNNHSWGLLAGLAAFLGHLFPVYLGFKGGKGVATGLGTLLAGLWPLGLLACGVWLLVALITRYSSLSALLAFLGASVAAWLYFAPFAAVWVSVLALLVIIKHRGNIRRLLAGQESRIGQKS